MRPVFVLLLLAACGNADPSAPTALARQACQRIDELAKSGCKLAVMPRPGDTIDQCVQDIVDQAAKIPASIWIPKCYVDNTSCDAVTKCLSGPPMPPAAP